MAEKDQMVEGFNAGYTLEKYRPELTQQISQAVEAVEDEFFQGFIAGSEQYSKERSRAKLLEKLRGDLSSPTRKGRDWDKEIDGPDIDR